jgi:hypothetical protein
VACKKGETYPKLGIWEEIKQIICCGERLNQIGPSGYCIYYQAEHADILIFFPDVFYCCVLHGSRNNPQLFPYAALYLNWFSFVKEKESDVLSRNWNFTRNLGLF